MRKYRKKRRTGRRILLVLIIIAAVLLIDSNYRIDVEEYSVTSDKIPAGFDGFRIVQLSDLHERVFGKDNGELFEKIRSADPDIIVITGDLTDGFCKDPEGYVGELTDGLAEIAPVFYTSGNHEWAAGDMNGLYETLEAHGARVLENSFTELRKNGDGIILAGAEDPNGPYDMETPAELMAEARAEYGDEYTVVLNHRNDRIELYSELGAGLVLSGHAHGGVVRLPLTDGLIDTNRNWFPTYTSGNYSLGGTEMIVSRGLGHLTVPCRYFENGLVIPRLLNRPHIPVIILKSGI